MLLRRLPLAGLALLLRLLLVTARQK